MADKYIVVNVALRTDGYSVFDADAGKYVVEYLYESQAAKIADTMNARITEKGD